MLPWFVSRSCDTGLDDAEPKEQPDHVPEMEIMVVGIQVDIQRGI